MRGPSKELEQSVDRIMDWFMTLVMPAIIAFLTLLFIIVLIAVTLNWLGGGFDADTCIVHDGLEYCR